MTFLKKNASVAVALTAATLMIGCSDDDDREDIDRGEIRQNIEQNIERNFDALESSLQFLDDVPAWQRWQGLFEAFGDEPLLRTDFADSRQRLNDLIERVVTPDNIIQEDDMVVSYRVRGEDLCPALEGGTGLMTALGFPPFFATVAGPGFFPGLEAGELTFDDCVARVNDAAVRAQVTSPDEGDVNIQLFVGTQNHEPIAYEFHRDRLAMEADYGELRGALVELGFDDDDTLEGELPETMEGRVRSELNREDEAHTRYVFDVLEEVRFVRGDSELLITGGNGLLGVGGDDTVLELEANNGDERMEIRFDFDSIEARFPYSGQLEFITSLLPVLGDGNFILTPGTGGGPDNNGTANNGVNNGTANNGTGVNNGTVNNGVNNGTANNAVNNVVNNGTVNNGTDNNGVNNGTVNNGTVNNGTDNNGTDNNGVNNVVNNGTVNNGTDNNGVNNGTVNNGTANNGVNNVVNNGTDNNGTANNGTANNGVNNGTANNGVNNGTANNGTDNNGVNNGTANNGTDNNGTDNNGTANNGTDNNGTANNGTDNNGTANNGTDNNGTDNNGAGEDRIAELRLDGLHLTAVFATEFDDEALRINDFGPDGDWLTMDLDGDRVFTLAFEDEFDVLVRPVDDETIELEFDDDFELRVEFAFDESAIDRFDDLQPWMQNETLVLRVNDADEPRILLRDNNLVEVLDGQLTVSSQEFDIERIAEPGECLLPEGQAGGDLPEDHPLFGITAGPCP